MLYKKKVTDEFVKDKTITILRLLDAKTDWLKTPKTTREYHIVNMAV